MIQNRIIVSALSLFLLVVGNLSVRADGDGLEFRAHTVQPERRTSLVLDGGKPFRFNDGFTLGFDLKLRREEHNFGYICRIIINDTLNVDLVSNAGWDNGQLSLTMGASSCLSIDDMRSIRGFGFDVWLPVSLCLDSREDRLSFKFGDYEFAAEAPLPKLKNVRIVFGLSDDSRFVSTDCPPMSLRNIRLVASGQESEYRWTLARHGDDFVLDEVHGRRAVVHNPVWETDSHLNWRESSHLSITGSHPQIAQYEKGDDMGLFVATADTLYYVALRGGRPSMKTGYAFGHPYNSTSNSLVYIRETDELISYSVTTDTLNRFDFDRRAWSNGASELKFSYLHHNELVIPENRELVVFGGYDEYTYHAELFTRSPHDSEWTEKDLSAEITPRYLAAASYAGNGKMFVLGGYGSRTGSQRESPQFFSDFYEIDLRTGKAEKKWAFENPENEVFGNAMIPDEDGSRLYVLSFRSDRNNTMLRLNSFDIATGERKIYPGTIPYGFHDTDSWCTLLRDSLQNRLLAVVSKTSRTGGSDITVWSMDWRPYLPEDILQEEERNTFPWILCPAAALFMFIAAGVMLLIRRRGSAGRSDPESVLAPAVSFRDSETDVLNLIGPFKWTGHDGEDRTAKFSVTLRNIFLYIVFHRIVTGSGVASRILDDVFWNSDPSEASNRRNVAMSRLRKLLATENIGELTCRNGVWEISLTDGLFCDLVRLEELLPEKDGTSLPDRNALEEILVICRRGTLLSGIWDEWCDRFKSWYTSRISEFLEKAYVSAQTNRDPALSLEIAEVLLVNDPIDENAIAIKCRSLYEMGRKGQAKTAFTAFLSEYEKLLGEPSKLDFQKIIKM